MCVTLPRHMQNEVKRSFCNCYYNLLRASRLSRRQNVSTSASVIVVFCVLGYFCEINKITLNCANWKSVEVIWFLEPLAENQISVRSRFELNHSDVGECPNLSLAYCALLAITLQMCLQFCYFNHWNEINESDKNKNAKCSDHLFTRSSNFHT